MSDQSTITGRPSRASLKLLARFGLPGNPFTRPRVDLPPVTTRLAPSTLGADTTADALKQIDGVLLTAPGTARG